MPLSLFRPRTQDVIQFAGTLHPVVIDGCPEVAGHIRHVLARWPEMPAAEIGDATRIFRQNGAYTVQSRWLDAPLEGLTDVAAACGGVVDAAQSYLDANPDHLCLHSATYETGGRLVVMTGSAHAGKSTLAARMAAEDVIIYCDDMLPVRGPDNYGVALGLPPRPRMPLPPSPVLTAHVERHTAASDGKYCYLDTSNLAPHGRTAPLGLLVLLDRRADGPAGFAPAGHGEALLHLVQRNMARSAPMQDIAARLAEVLANVPCVKLFYSDLDDVAAVLRTRLGQWPLDVESLVADQPAPGQPREAANEQDGPGREPHAADVPMSRAPGIAVKRFKDTNLLFDVGGASVFHLNPLAAAVWTLLETPHSARMSADTIADAFPETPYETILDDMRALYADLAAAGAISSSAAS